MNNFAFSKGARVWLMALLATAWGLPARAQLTIEITGVGAVQIPVATLAFAGDNAAGASIAEVIETDLTRSGLIKKVDTKGATRAADPSQVNVAQWKGAGADAIVMGSAQPAGDGKFAVRYYLLDANSGAQMLGFEYNVPARDLRLVSHKIADQVFEKLTGIPGVFSTRIAYVSKTGNTYRLQVADYDGENAATVLTSPEPIISPAWSPDGRRLAYVSFESRKPVVWVHDITNAQRKAVGNFRGSNSAPAWSPDGQRLAVALTQDGPTQVYIINADGSGLRRLTTSGAIDTSPAWMPDGKSVLFTSDRGGAPQIYRQSISGGGAERLTFEGSYNAAPRIAPDGKSFVFIRRDGRREMIAIQDFESKQMQVLTGGGIDESPTFAPNGKTILYASVQGGRGILATVSSDGRVKQRITTAGSDIREPAWGPIIQ